MQKRTITIKDIAEKAGMSCSLVSFVLNGKSVQYKVNPDTTKKVLAAAKALNYKPNLAAQSLRSGKTKTIGVILSDISNPFFAEIARSIEDIASKRGYTVVFGSSDENPDKLKNLISSLSARGIDGFIIVPSENSEKTIKSLAKEKAPIVLLDRKINSLKLSSVVLNNFEASKKATELLIKRGFKDIELFSYNLKISNILERDSGYETQMKASKLDKYIKINKISYDKLSTEFEDVVLGALKSKKGKKAFLFATNSICLNALKILHKHGYKVPQDVSILSFDYSDIFDFYSEGLAYLEQPISGFGEAAANLLFDNLNGGSPSIKTISLDATLHIKNI